MRLSKDMIKHIADTIASNLESRGLVEYEASRDSISAIIAEAITADMLAEEKLNKDVEKMLAMHEAEIAKEQMDYRKMFELTKRKLAKDRGIVL